MRSVIIAFLILMILLGIGAIVFTYLNYSNPHLLEIVVGTTMIGLFIGIASSIIHTLFDQHIKENPLISGIFVLCFLIILIAVFIYASNVPKSIKREIPVTYLLNLKKQELSYGFMIDSTVAEGSYSSAHSIFRQFKGKNIENAIKIEQIVSKDHSASEAILFHDFTEYLIAYFLAVPFVTGEMESHLYRHEISEILGWPDKRIRGEYKQLDYITGDFKNNSFYGIMEDPHITIQGMRLPKDTDIQLIRDNKTTSQFIIKNNFMTVTIGIVYLTGSSGSRVPIFPPSAFVPSATSEEERKGPFKRYESMIYYDVSFNKFRYGSPERKYYEEWAENLFFMLERKFSWGSPEFLRSLYNDKKYWESFFQ